MWALLQPWGLSGGVSQVEPMQSVSREWSDVDDHLERQLLGREVVEPPTVVRRVREFRFGREDEDEEVVALLLELLEEVTLGRARLDGVVQGGDETALHKAQLLEGLPVAERDLERLAASVPPEEFLQGPEPQSHLVEGREPSE